MFIKRGGTGLPGGPTAIMLLMAGVMMLSVISCSSGVSEEEFNGTVKDLEAEKAITGSLKSELATERASRVRLAEAVDHLEGRVAELESELAKERAAIKGNQERVDVAEAEAALLAAFLAWNRKDREGFIASFTDEGISQTLLAVPETVGEPPIALRRMMNAAVIDETATIHAMFALGTQRHSVRYSMAKQGGVWTIEGEERLSPKVHGDMPVVNLQLDGCSRLSKSNTVIDRIVAFRVENSGQEHPHLILKRVPEGIEPGMLLHGDIAPPGGTAEVAFVRETKTGESINVAFTEPLQPGRYVLLCYPPDPVGFKRVQPAAGSIVATYAVK